jgi:uncharacterized protein involved in exopolysaccharide biosynthesis
MIEQRRVTERVSRLRAIEPPQEQPVDVRRYVNALRGSWLLIAAIVIPVTAGVLALSLTSPKTYSSTATMLLDESPDTASADAARQLATIQTLLTTRNVLHEAARRLPGESAQTLAGKITAAVDPNANIVRIKPRRRAPARQRASPMPSQPSSSAASGPANCAGWKPHAPASWTQWQSFAARPARGPRSRSSGSG